VKHSGCYLVSAVAKFNKKGDICTT